MNNKADNQYKHFKTVEYLRYWHRVIRFKYFVDFLVKWYKMLKSESIKSDNDKNIKNSMLYIYLYLYIEYLNHWKIYIKDIKLGKEKEKIAQQHYRHLLCKYLYQCFYINWKMQLNLMYKYTIYIFIVIKQMILVINIY